MTLDDLDMAHYFGGGVYVKDTAFPAGAILVQHKHEHDHLSYLVTGSVVVEVDGVRVNVDAPACIKIEAGKHHGVKALTDCRWLCIHATDCTDEAQVDKVLVAPGPADDPATMQAIAKGMR